MTPPASSGPQPSQHKDTCPPSQHQGVWLKPSPPTRLHVPCPGELLAGDGPEPFTTVHGGGTAAAARAWATLALGLLSPCPRPSPQSSEAMKPPGTLVSDSGRRARVHVHVPHNNATGREVTFPLISAARAVWKPKCMALSLYPSSRSSRAHGWLPEKQAPPSLMAPFLRLSSSSILPGSAEGRGLSLSLGPPNFSLNGAFLC